MGYWTEFSIEFIASKDTIQKILSNFELDKENDCLYYHVYPHELENNGEVEGVLYGTDIKVKAMPKSDERILLGFNNSKIESNRVSSEYRGGLCRNNEAIVKYISQKYNCEVRTYESSHMPGSKEYEVEYYKGKLYRWRSSDPWVDVFADDEEVAKRFEMNEYDHYEVTPWKAEDGHYVIDQSPGRYDDPEIWKEYVHKVLNIPIKE